MQVGNIIDVFKTFLSKDSKKEVKKIIVNCGELKNKITIVFIDDTEVINNDAKIQPFIINSLKKALKSNSASFEIDFITNQVNLIQ